MQDVFTSVTMLGIGIAMSPIPILATILLLSTREARRNGVAYAVGFFIGLTVLSALVVWVVHAYGRSPRSGTSHVVVLGTIAMGLSLMGFSAWQLTRRHQSVEAPPVPRWLRVLDQFRTPQSLGLGLFNSAFNAKNFALLLVAASIVGQSSLDPLQSSIALALLLLFAMVGIIAPLGVYLVGGQRSTTTLEKWKLWLIRHNGSVLAVLFLFFGIILVIKGVLKLNTLG
jgi:threonine/homoserine/homoserine lactone efflux protein